MWGEEEKDVKDENKWKRWADFVQMVLKMETGVMSHGGRQSPEAEKGSHTASKEKAVQETHFNVQPPEK